MKKLGYLLLVLAVVFPRAQSAFSADDTIEYVGSSTVGKFMVEAERVYTQATFSIDTKPESGGGERAVAAGMVQLGGVAREVKPEILAQGVNKYLIGKDAIGVLLNAANPVSDLSFDQLKGIFSGAIRNWKDVGGADLPINVYIVNPQSATRKVFQKHALDGEEYGGERIKTIKPDTAIPDEVAADLGGIGQLSLALASGKPGIKTIRVNGQELSVNNPNYPISRPLHLVTKGEATGAVKAFIDWALSEEGQSVVKKYFVGAY